MNKELRFINSQKSMGIIGEDVGYGLCVGDLTAALYEGELIVNVICKELGGEAFQMGLKSISLKDMVFKNKLKLVLSFKYLTKEILEDLGYNLEIAEAATKKMTLDEVQNKLGYRIEIVE